MNVKEIVEGENSVIDSWIQYEMNHVRGVNHEVNQLIYYVQW